MLDVDSLGEASWSPIFALSMCAEYTALNVHLCSSAAVVLIENTPSAVLKYSNTGQF